MEISYVNDILFNLYDTIFIDLLIEQINYSSSIFYKKKINSVHKDKISLYCNSDNKFPYEMGIENINLVINRVELAIRHSINEKVQKWALLSKRPPT